MLSVLMSAFLCFSTTVGNINAISEAKSNLGINVVTSDVVPSANITYGSYESDWFYHNFVGRHNWVSIDSSYYMGRIVVQQLSPIYNPNALEDFHFTESISTTETSTISTTTKLSSSITSSIGVKAGLDNVVLSGNYKINNSYVIENTQTYSYSEQTTRTVTYNVIKDKVKNHDFYLGSVAYVYKIKCQTWQIDDFWWGSYEVSGSRTTFYTYLTLNPTITIAFADGGYID